MCSAAALRREGGGSGGTPQSLTAVSSPRTIAVRYVKDVLSQKIFAVRRYFGKSLDSRVLSGRVAQTKHSAC